MRSKIGFTLMEMLVAMTIVGILAAIVSPGVMKAYRNRQCVAFMQQLQSAIHYASSQRGQYDALRLRVTGAAASNLSISVIPFDSTGAKAALENVPIDNGGYIYGGTFEMFTILGASTSAALGGPAIVKYIVDIRAFPSSVIDTDVSNTYFAIPVAGAQARTGVLAGYNVIRFKYTSSAADVFYIDIDTNTGATTTSGF